MLTHPPLPGTARRKKGRFFEGLNGKRWKLSTSQQGQRLGIEMDFINKHGEEKAE